ncbi:hypothetical protein OOK60_06015 [Trichothermofontia sichuanensis B231]|uniref:hypothetical protein n=1 Tax=Trichothermofontia sichuanensis TaxID=3045816 RepID=UPI0022483FDD|nr:hypothetical protein [Trichothermofontia sichuanensis]UZQ55624.1 hypothetical protein OOK60_06015 [Trichothermofontia sichuanensis B231]
MLLVLPTLGFLPNLRKLGKMVQQRARSLDPVLVAQILALILALSVSKSRKSGQNGLIKSDVIRIHHWRRNAIGQEVGAYVWHCWLYRYPGRQ